MKVMRKNFPKTWNAIALTLKKWWLCQKNILQLLYTKILRIGLTRVPVKKWFYSAESKIENREWALSSQVWKFSLPAVLHITRGKQRSNGGAALCWFCLRLFVGRFLWLSHVKPPGIAGSLRSVRLRRTLRKARNFRVLQIWARNKKKRHVL